MYVVCFELFILPFGKVRVLHRFVNKLVLIKARWVSADELSRAYPSCLDQHELVDEPMQYADFAEWQNEQLEANDVHALTGKTYWQKREAAGVPKLAIPLERRAERTGAFEPDSIAINLDSPLSKIEAMARKCETSVSALLFTCWQAVLWRLAGQI